MAQRYGGKYSPTQQQPNGPEAQRPVAPPPSSDQRRASLLGLFSLALVIPGFQGDPRKLMLSLAAGAALLLAAWMTREGIRAAEV